ncbi:hypothetical protein OG216_30160 [Streptomycetaceae bacterium NBC_01309]
MDVDGTRADGVAGGAARDRIPAPEAPLSPRQVDRAVRKIYLTVLVLGLSTALCWWSWATVSSRDGDRTRVERQELAAVPGELCDGLVEVADAVRLSELREAARISAEPIRVFDRAPHSAGCWVEGGRSLTVVVAPVERIDPAVLDVRGVASHGVLTGVTGMTGSGIVWAARACPQIGPERALLAYAGLSEPRNTGWAGGDEGIDRRDVLAAIAVRALGRVSDTAGCAGTPPAEGVGSTPPAVPDRADAPADPACAEAAAADAGQSREGSPTRRASMWVPAGAPVSVCALTAREGPQVGVTGEIVAYRGLLAGIGAESPGVGFPAEEGSLQRRPFRAEARCGGERVTWLAGVGGKDLQRFLPQDRAAVVADIRSRFARFVDANVRLNGCQVVSGIGSGSGGGIGNGNGTGNGAGAGAGV